MHRLSRRLLGLGLAVGLAAPLLIPATASAATSRRIAGDNRYDTAAKVSADSFASASTVYVATGTDFPDALAGGPAAATRNGPVLLVRPDAVPSATANELERLGSITTIYVLGGPGAVSEAVEQELAAYADNVVRLAGDNRFETGAAISANAFSPGVPLAYVATGLNFPDALAGGAAAGFQGGPIVLVKPDTVPSASAGELDRLDPGQIRILGGPAVVSPEVEQQLSQYTDGAVTRDAGADRFKTAVETSEGAFADPAAVSTVYLATGASFPDALAGGPAAAMAPGPLLLVSGDCIRNEVWAEINRLNPDELVILGGQSAVSSGIQNQNVCDALVRMVGSGADGFQPANVSLAAGTTLTVRNDDSTTHTFTADDSSWDSGNMAPGESYQRTFDTPGTFDYFCTIHPVMTGTVEVK